jgi:hypothetical protein
MTGMRRWALLVVALALMSAGVSAGASKPAFRATLKTAGHHPKVIVKWRYSVHVTDPKGKPLHARITVQLQDPFGSIHPIPFGRNTTNITNHPIFGMFRDWVNWPRSSAIGITLTFRVVVTTSLGKKLLTYPVSPPT